MFKEKKEKKHVILIDKCLLFYNSVNDHYYFLNPIRFRFSIHYIYYRKDGDEIIMNSVFFINVRWFITNTVLHGESNELHLQNINIFIKAKRINSTVKVLSINTSIIYVKTHTWFIVKYIGPHMYIQGVTTITPMSYNKIKKWFKIQIHANHPLDKTPTKFPK